MTSNIKIPKISKDNNMSAAIGIKSFVGRKMTKPVDFMGDKVNINKLSVAQIQDLQSKAKEAETGNSSDDDSGLQVLCVVIRAGVEGGADLTDEDFKEMPMDELSKLSAAIMKFSGFGAEAGK
jgi:hypothetical protein